MKISFAIFLTLLFAISACVPATPTKEFPPSAESTEIPTMVSVIDPEPSPTPPAGPALLPTFSLATLPTSGASSPPAQDASSLPTRNPFPLPTVDLSSIPTLAPVTPWPTALPLPTLSPQPPYYGSPEPNADCFAIASNEGVRLGPGPFISHNQLSPTMEPGVRYRVTDKYPTFVQFAREGGPVGWVQNMTTGVSIDGAGCAVFFQRLDDARSLTSFPGLCFFTVNRPTQAYFDKEMTNPTLGFEASSGPFVVLWKSRKSIYSSLSHAGPSFYLPTDNVRIFGDCEGIPTSATVTTAGWLWSKPDESQGEKLLRLTIGMKLHIEGKRPPDTSGEAAWVQAIAEIQGESISGWVWSGLLTFD